MKIGVQELIIVLIVVIVIFGPTQIPKLSKMFGKSVKSFKEGMSEEEEPAPTVEKESADVRSDKQSVRNEQEEREE